MDCDLTWFQVFVFLNLILKFCKRSNALKAFHEKLTNNGKLKMLAIVAVMRKLLHY
ncbi:hypothetical protein AGMMS49990_03740 [Endomicrobiia bacterium]|nr:hypothetical protein AGMMS49990_03740 [Endomicrobiia bacterium]